MDLSLLPRGAFPVTLDRERLILFDNQATWLLQQKYGPKFRLALYTVVGGTSLQLTSMEALEFFLFAGLQKDARSHGETLTLEQTQELIFSWNAEEILKRVAYALVGNTATPATLGEMRAVSPTGKLTATENPAPPTPGPTKVSTSMKRSASRTPSSAGHRKGSGRSLSASSTSRGKARTRKGT